MSLYDDVMKLEPKKWSLPFYKLGSCCEDVDNNATESFNATIVGARAKAVVPMLETIRRQAMVRIAKRSKKSLRRQQRFTKYVVEMLKAEKEDADKCITTPGTHGVFDVKLFGQTYDVNTNRMTCTCGKWQITGIPCEHAYGAMIDVGLDVDDYVSEFFSTHLWQQTYSESISTVRGPRFWMKKDKYKLVVEAPEPALPGRKKKNKKKKFPRFKGKNESPKKKKKKTVETLGRKGRTMHCSKCGESDHNAATCKLHPKKKIKKEPKEKVHSYHLTLLVLVLVVFSEHFIFVSGTRKHFGSQWHDTPISNNSRLRRKMQSLNGYASTSWFFVLFFQLVITLGCGL